VEGKEEDPFWVSQPQAQSGMAAHRGFGGGNMRKPRAAPASSNAAAATGSGGLHVKENGVRTAVNAGKRNGDDFGCRLEAVAGTRAARGSAVGRWRPDELGSRTRRCPRR
jgi:hypothetical protein